MAFEKIQTKQSMQSMVCKCPKHIAGVLESQLSGLIDNHYQAGLPDNAIAELNREIVSYLAKLVDITARHSTASNDTTAKAAGPQVNPAWRKGG